ncbi:nuclear segregation protein [Xylogone sp. PMI_703]|nr:nuclear segregation protein [Xylogone sp. PMI_703]
MADTATAPAAAKINGKEPVEVKKKPERPDEEAFKTALKKAEKEHADSMAKFNAVKTKLDNAQPKNKDSPAAKRRAELLAQLKEIREQQGAGKAGRNQTFEQIKKLDEQLKSRIAEQKQARGRVAFKSVDEVDREIDRLEKQVNGGMMKLVDEKKALTEISNLKKQRKNFASFDDAQKGIDETKAKLKSLRDSLDDPESKALSEKYNKIQAELDAIKAEQDDIYKNLNQLRDERTKLHAEQQEKYAAIKKLKDDYYQQRAAAIQYEKEARARARERQRLERETQERERRKERAQRLLAEASDPAYLDEIRRAEGLLRFLDPTYSSEKAPLVAPSGLQAQAQRTVNDTEIKGMKVVRKDEEDYFVGTGGKKGKKGRKAAAAATPESPASATASGKYNCPPSVMEDCNAMGINPPMSAADIPAVTEKVKEKLEFWKKDQEAQTQKNIEKAKKEVERLDAEEEAAANGSKDEVAEVTEELKTASVEA